MTAQEILVRKQRQKADGLSDGLAETLLEACYLAAIKNWEPHALKSLFLKELRNGRTLIAATLSFIIEKNAIPTTVELQSWLNRACGHTWQAV